MAMHGGKMGFGKIIKMIDNLVADLHKEQGVDDDKKVYCLAEFDKGEDKKKGLELDISDLGKAIANAEETIATLASEIEALEDGIKKLDKQVAEATEQRKEEHADNVETITNDNAAKEIIGIAKNRLNKFYNPKLYKPAPKRELTEDQRITLNMGGTLAPTNAPGGIAGTGVTALAQAQVNPGPPPETFGAYAKKGQESTGRSQCATHIQSDALVFCKFAFGCRLVQFRIIKFVQPILCNSDDFFGSIIVCNGLDVICMLFLSLFCRLCYLLIQLLDAIFKSLDL
jgi:hypothetical protein